MRRAVFLDRDGVLNRAVIRNGKPFPPANAAEMEIVPEAPVALACLRDAGFLLLVVTNQPDISRGTAAVDVVEAINTRLRAALPLDDVLVCPHDDHDRCVCRKPAPGLLIAASTRYGIELGKSFMVGDRWRDVEAGHAAGCTSIFIDAGYDERRPEADYVATNIADAARWIVASGQSGRQQ